MLRHWKRMASDGAGECQLLSAAPLRPCPCVQLWLTVAGCFSRPRSWQQTWRGHTCTSKGGRLRVAIKLNTGTMEETLRGTLRVEAVSLQEKRQGAGQKGKRQAHDVRQSTTHRTRHTLSSTWRPSMLASADRSRDAPRQRPVFNTDAGNTLVLFSLSPILLPFSFFRCPSSSTGRAERRRLFRQTTRIDFDLDNLPRRDRHLTDISTSRRLVLADLSCTTVNRPAPSTDAHCNNTLL